MSRYSKPRHQTYASEQEHQAVLEQKAALAEERAKHAESKRSLQEIDTAIAQLEYYGSEEFHADQVVVEEVEDDYPAPPFPFGFLDEKTGQGETPSIADLYQEYSVKAFPGEEEIVGGYADVRCYPAAWNACIISFAV